MKAYKGFDKDLKCRGFQYEIGNEYREDNAKLCSTGFHACENPLDTFAYYGPSDGSRYCEVEVDEVSDERHSDDSKICGKVIKIGAELDVAGICKAHFEYVKSKCNPANSNAAGDRESASAGYRGSASAGKNGIACVISGKVKGEIGCAICCTETDDEGNNIAVCAAIVDGETIKADTWYKVESGKFVEVTE